MAFPCLAYRFALLYCFISGCSNNGCIHSCEFAASEINCQGCRYSSRDSVGDFVGERSLVYKKARDDGSIVDRIFDRLRAAIVIATATATTQHDEEMCIFLTTDDEEEMKYIRDRLQSSLAKEESLNVDKVQFVSSNMQKIFQKNKKDLNITFSSWHSAKDLHTFMNKFDARGLEYRSDLLDWMLFGEADQAISTRWVAPLYALPGCEEDMLDKRGIIWWIRHHSPTGN
jgi:hypothetical protein